ncbi:MAG: AMP-binding protein [Clostridia bacterium]|jgi:acetyl-CoA synthetase|nr:AMP-binding protein [Clostridia bacterium]
MNLLGRYLTKIEHEGYENFAKDTDIIVPENFNYGYDIIDEYAKLCPDKRALVWCNDKGEEKIFTFGDMKVLSDKVAYILDKSGVHKGDFVMTMLNRRYEYWITAIACHKIGAVLVPATYLLTAKDIAYRINNADVKVLIVTNEDDVTKHVAEAIPMCPSLKKVFTTTDSDLFESLDNAIDNAPEGFVPREKTTNDDKFLVYFTSGTTGNPKMVAHKYLYPLGHMITAKFWQDVVDDGLHLTMAETGWAKCSWGKIYGQWIAGTAIFVYDYFGKFTPTDILPLISKYKITTFCAPPTIYRFLCKEDLSHYDFSSITHCSTAGEALNPEVAKQFKDQTGLNIYEGFGQTESTVILATFKYMDIKQGSMGKPSPIYNVELLDNDDMPVAQGETGEVCIRLRENQVGLIYQYHNDEERTKATFANGIYHTGDLAYADSDGYYWYVSRKDDIIKSSGYRIGPFEVESALHEHPAVLECAITGAPDPLRGQVVKATIVLAKGYEPSEALIKELQNHVKKATAPYKYPRIVEFVSELPKTISGKIMRKDLRAKDNK